MMERTLDRVAELQDVKLTFHVSKEAPVVRRQYFIELGAGLVLYAILLVGSLHVLHAGGVTGLWRPVVSLVPMIAAAWCCWAILRQLRRMDEFQLRVQLEALAFAFAGTALLTFGYGFLEVAGYRLISMFFVWPLMAVLWEIGLLLARRRYQ
jgi:hypothetical protein